jgi:hypothetical protein
MNQVYFNGDFYQCAVATIAGESPTTQPTSWVKIVLLSKWRWVLAQLTYAGLLAADGQTDKASAARSMAYGRVGMGLEDLKMQEAEEERYRTSSCRGRPARVNTGRTRPVKASVILEDAYRLIGWDTEQLDTREKADARMALSQALQEVWEAWWWQELMVTTPVVLETPYAALHQYLAGELAYSEAQDWFYQALAPTLTAPPDDETNGNTVWARYVESAADRWDSDGAYVTGDRVSWAGTDWQRVTDSLPTEEPGTGSAWLEVAAWTPILPYTDYAGNVQGPHGPIRSVSGHDPRLAFEPNFFELDVTADGTRVLGLTTGRPWVAARRVTPILTGDDYDATAAYEATDESELVYDPTLPVTTTPSTTEIYWISGDPNGVQSATRPAMAYSVTGSVWIKTGSGTNNTGWELIVGDGS